MARSDGHDLLTHKRARLLALQPELRAAYPHALPAGTLLFRCRHCDGVYPLNHFSRNHQRRYGIRTDCRRCRRRERDPEAHPPDTALTEKYCRGCRAWHPIAAFHHDCSRADGYSPSCRAHARRRRQERTAARHFTAVAARRREQTIRLCGELGIDVPAHDLKRCTRCQAVKPLAEFGNDWERGDRKHGHCLDCHR